MPVDSYGATSRQNFLTDDDIVAVASLGHLNKICSPSSLRALYIYRVFELMQINEMISRILVAVDGSQHADKALEYASNLAKKTAARLLIVHVAEEFRNIGYSITKELEQRNRAVLQRYQSKAKKLVKRKNVNTIEVKGNDIGEEILQTADKRKIDTIVVGSRGIRENKEFLLGSVSYKVSHYAKCPVIIVR